MSTEADRIRSEYARRAAQIPDERYAPTAPENVLIDQEVERLAIDRLRAEGMLPLAGRRVLDAGCGNGGWLMRLESWGADRERLAGIDLVPARAVAARERLPGADVREGDAAALPWPDGTFDVVLHRMMLSSILDPAVRRAVAAEMARVLAADGMVLWYDFFVADPRNRQVRGVGRRELKRLFPGFEVRARRATLAPPLARVVAPRSRALAAALTSTRALDTHLVASLSRARAGRSSTRTPPPAHP